jgi:hypothetical protein
MTDSDGALSVDFLVGVTIFMVAFIWVATLVPNLFLGVSAHGIDFDAVAYRTGVILAEDPGATNGSVTGSWENQKDKGLIERFGLAVTKETPNILSETKVNRFFNTTAFSPYDYRLKAIFGEYPYRFRICLREVGENATCVGETLPDSNYGYIRREVKIKHFSNATIDKTDVVKFRLNNTENVSSHDFSIVINTKKLLNENITNPVTNPNFDAAYRIDPRSDWINITIEDLDESPPLFNWTPSGPLPPTLVPGSSEINLTKVTFSQTRYGFPGLFTIPPGPVPQKNFTYIGNIDGSITPQLDPTIENLEDKQNITFAFQPGFFTAADPTGAIFINLTFKINETAHPGGWGFLNNTQSQPWDYNYNPTDVTQPTLTDAVLEVAVW